MFSFSMAGSLSGHPLDLIVSLLVDVGADAEVRRFRCTRYGRSRCHAVVFLTLDEDGVQAARSDRVAGSAAAAGRRGGDIDQPRTCRDTVGQGESIFGARGCRIDEGARGAVDE